MTKAPQAPASPALLGTITNSSPPPAKKHPDSVSRAVARFALQTAIRRILLTDRDGQKSYTKLATGEIVTTWRNRFISGTKIPYAHRTAYCLRVLAVYDGSRRVSLLHYPERKAGGLRGLVRCASIWLCPLCAAQITEERRKQYKALFKRMSQPPVILTLTLRHNRRQPLQRVLAAILNSYTAMFSKNKSANMWIKRWSIVGRSRGLEVTYGRNGWHVHLHIALALSEKLTDINLDDFQADCTRRWGAKVEAQGGYASPIHGARVSIEADPSYIAKLGLEDVYIVRKGGRWSIAEEMTKAPIKQGKLNGITPQGLVLIYMTGEAHRDGDFVVTPADAERLFLEYVIAMHRQQQLVASGLIKEMLGKEATISDRELVEQDSETPIMMGDLELDDWRKVLKGDKRGVLVDVLSTGDADQLTAFLAGIGIEPEPEAYRHLHTDLDQLSISERVIPAGDLPEGATVTRIGWLNF